MKSIFLSYLILMIASTILSANESEFHLSTAVVGMSMDYREYNDNNEILDSEKSKFSGIKGVDIGFSYLDASQTNHYSESE